MIKAGWRWFFGRWFTEHSRKCCVLEASERLLCIGHIQAGLAERLRKSFVIEGSVQSFGAGRIQVWLVEYVRTSLAHCLKFIRAHNSSQKSRLFTLFCISSRSVTSEDSRNTQ